MLVNLTPDYGQILTSTHNAKISGSLRFSSALNVARVRSVPGLFPERFLCSAGFEAQTEQESKTKNHCLCREPCCRRHSRAHQLGQEVEEE